MPGVGAQGAASAPAPALAPSAAPAQDPNLPTGGPWTALGIGASSDQVDFGPRYRIDRMLGQGGMGAVYKAWDKELQRPVALKLIRPDLARDPGVEARFKQELLLASKVSHKNILRIHDLGEAAGVKFISMAYVEGQDLHGLLTQQGKLTIEHAIKIARQLCGALDAAHSEGVVHRDFKPQNILLDKQENVYVSDFGLAKSLEQDTGMTKSGEFLGTPRYMAPEQVQGGKIDHRADLYALGLILYEMVTGDVPFHADTTLQLMYKRVHEAPPSPKTLNPDLPDWIVRVIMKCIERDPAQRYQTAGEILHDLDTATAPPK
ncbi:MAG: serine/threonine-protein kinase, partial [Terriglobales bacterium]